MREKRTLAEWPDEASWRRVDPELGRQLEDWLNDRFGGRSTFVEWQGRLEYGVNRRVRNEDMFTGSDGWLFYKKAGSLQGFQRTDNFIKSTRLVIARNLIRRTKWLNAQGISLFILVVPAKNRVYGEYYPSGIRVNGDVGRAKHMVDIIREHPWTIPIVYALEPMLEEKEKDRALLYYQQDTHWTDAGAYVGYRTLMAFIQESMPDVVSLTDSDFQWEFIPERGGDLTRMARVDLIQSTPKVQYQELDPDHPLPFDTLTPPPGPVTHTLQPGRPLKALVFMDSFGEAMIPFLSSTFGEVEYIRRHDIHSFQEKITTFKPDLVIHEVAERLMPALCIDQPPLREIAHDAL